MKENNYSLWLMPEGENFQKYTDLIKKLAKEHGGPTFVPHITLLGNILLPEAEVLDRAQLVVENQRPFTVNLMGIGCEDYYFRTLYAKAEIPKELQALHDRAKEIFRMNDIPPYMAHLSFLYGNYPKELKDKIIKEIGDQSASLPINSIYVFYASAYSAPETWHQIAELPLNNP